MAFKKFDTSKFTKEDKQIVNNFFVRRKIFDEFQKQNRSSYRTCPSCGYPTLRERGVYDICTVCDWEDDNQDDATADEIWGGPNKRLSLTESRLNFGRILKHLAATEKAHINLIPGEVIETLQKRGKVIEDFSKKHITMQTRFDDPVWKEWKQLHLDTLVGLVTKD